VGIKQSRNYHCVNVISGVRAARNGASSDGHDEQVVLTMITGRPWS